MNKRTAKTCRNTQTVVLVNLYDFSPQMTTTLLVILLFIQCLNVYHITAYCEKIGFKGQLLIEPKPKEPTKHQYDYGKTSLAANLKDIEIHV